MEVILIHEQKNVHPYLTHEMKSPVLYTKITRSPLISESLLLEL